MHDICILQRSYSFVGVAHFEPNCGDARTESMIQIGQLLIADLRKGLETVQALFKE